MNVASNKTIKLLLQRRKNRPEMKASFLFNILETIADNLSALIEFTTHIKNNEVLSYHLLLKIANISVGKSGDDSSALIEFTPL